MWSPSWAASCTPPSRPRWSPTSSIGPRAGGSKHRFARNWIKTYDKVTVLRVETTINNPREFRVLRVVTDERGRRERRWCQMNKGVANMWRYFQVSIQANRRYLDALAAAPLKGKGVASFDTLCRSRNKHGRHYARFNPVSPADLALFRAVMAGEYTIVWFRNADLAARLYRHPPATPRDVQRRCARVSRLTAKLRGHGLVPHGESGAGSREVVTNWAEGKTAPHGQVGAPPAVRPAVVSIWATHSTGTGTQTVTWQPTPGRWTVVVMNADASPGLSVSADVGATAPNLGWIAVGLLAGGGLLLLIGGLLWSSR